MRYPIILFDLCNTLYPLNYNNLPLVEVDGGMVRSTSGVLYPILAEVYPELTFSAFHRAFAASWEWEQGGRGEVHREVLAEERFQWLFQHLGLPVDGQAGRVRGALLDLHARHIATALEFPEEHRHLLTTLSDRGYRLGLVTNFDHAPTVHQVLAREGIAERFETVVISAEVGWRKPHPQIFREALAQMRASPEQILFVGDTYDGDVLGAKGMGMACAWLRHAQAPPPVAEPVPDYIIARLSDLPVS